MLTPDDLTSVAAMLAARARAEAEAKPILDAEARRFLEESYGLTFRAYEGSVLLTYGAVYALWEQAVERMHAKLPAALATRIADQLLNDELPSVTYATATARLAELAAAGTTRAGVRAVLRASLGLDHGELGDLERIFGLGDAESGRLLNPDGSTRHVQSATDAAARTSATAEVGSETLDLLRAEGYTHKRWATRFDARVRDTHRAADRQTVPLEESFIVGGVALRYPADPLSGSTAETINCRCVLVGVRPR